VFRAKRLRGKLVKVFVLSSVALLIASLVAALSSRFGWPVYWTLVPLAVFFIVLVGGATFRTFGRGVTARRR
jgi:hypothetical protein